MFDIIDGAWRSIVWLFKASLFTGCVFIVAWLISQLLIDRKAEKSTYEQVKAGSLILRCDLPQGTIDVDPAKITGYYEGQWQFGNGWSSSCILIVRGNKQ